MDEYITWKDLRKVIPFSRQYIYELERLGKFPRRIKFGERRVAWLKKAIAEWVASKRPPDTN